MIREANKEKEFEKLNKINLNRKGFEHKTADKLEKLQQKLGLIKNNNPPKMDLNGNIDKDKIKNADVDEEVFMTQITPAKSHKAPGQKLEDDDKVLYKLNAIENRLVQAKISRERGY